MKRTISLLGLLLASRLANADAPISSEIRNVPAFHGVELAGSFDVDVAIGSPARVEVSGESDLLEQVTTTVEDGVLRVGTKPHDGRDHHSNHLRVRVTAPDITSLALTGSGDVKATGIASASLAINLRGSGEILAVGSTGTLRAVLGGSGELRASELNAREVDVDLSGSGDAKLRATESVNARLTGSGSIDVQGHPAVVHKSKTGSGSVHIH